MLSPSSADRAGINSAHWRQPCRWPPRMSAISSTMSTPLLPGTQSTSASVCFQAPLLHLRTSRLGRYDCCSAVRQARRGEQCRMASDPALRLESDPSDRGGYLRRSRATASSWRRVSQRHRDRAGRLADPAEGSLRQSRRAISAGASLTFANRETSGSACGADAQVVTKSSHFLFFDPKRPNRPKSRQSRAAVLFGRLSAPR